MTMIDPDRLRTLWSFLTPAEQREASGLLKAAHQRPLPDLEYQGRPVEWARDILGIPTSHLRWSELPEYALHRWDGTVDPLARFVEHVADVLTHGRGEDAAGNRIVAVESATGTGKTFTTGWLPLYVLACYKSLTVTVAPKEKQLAKQLWKELGRHWLPFTERYPQVGRLQLAIYAEPDAANREEWAVIAWAAGVEAGKPTSVRMQGFHAERMLLLGEEYPGVPPAISASLINTLSGEKNVLAGVGNPDSQQDALHRLATLKGALAIRVSALDHPNVVLGRELIPGACTRTSVAMLQEAWKDAPAMFDSRARGISPAQAANALIQRSWLDAAAQRWRTERARFEVGLPARGLDFAQSEAGDKCATAYGTGAALERIVTQHTTNVNKHGEQLALEAKAERVHPLHIGADPVGVGAGAVNEIEKLLASTITRIGGSMSPVTGAERAAGDSHLEWLVDANTFRYLRDQVLWQLREDLRRGRLALHPTVVETLIAVGATDLRWEPRDGKVRVESKKDFKDRTGLQSPDELDAASYWNWARRRELWEQEREPTDEERSAKRFDLDNKHPGLKRGIPQKEERPVQRRQRLEELEHANPYHTDTPWARSPRPGHPEEED